VEWINLTITLSLAGRSRDRQNRPTLETPSSCGKRVPRPGSGFHCFLALKYLLPFGFHCDECDCCSGASKVLTLALEMQQPSSSAVTRRSLCDGGSQGWVDAYLRCVRGTGPTRPRSATQAAGLQETAHILPEHAAPAWYKRQRGRDSRQWFHVAMPTTCTARNGKVFGRQDVWRSEE
jgi:hypothetical protein